MKVLVIDNYDSFTYNLVQFLGELGAELDVVRNDKAEVAELLGRWWSEGHELVFSWRGGRLQARVVDGVPGRDTSFFERLDGERWRCVEGRERGELLRVVRDDSGAVEKVYFATYPLSRRASTF